MRPYRRRRAYTIVVFLAVAGLIFLCFQVLSVQMLNQQSRDDSSNSEADSDKGCKNGDCPEAQSNPPKGPKSPKPLTKQERESQKRALARVIDDLRAKHASPAPVNKPNAPEIHYDLRTVKSKEKQPVLRMQQLDELLRPRGVPRHWANLYQADGNGMFSCIDSRVKIPFARVNDDYCDCKDGSDEPGTSACNNGRFYCEFQLTEENQVWLPSSRVNDGLCDCCDGSDEWNAPPLAARVAARHRKPGSELDVQPCINRCDKLLKDHAEEEATARDGGKVKQMYIEESRGKSNPNGIYGSNGEFTPLSENCYQARADKYSYTVCPFREVKQISGSSSTIIGRSPAEWISSDPKHLKLKMDHGDQHQCPGMKKRISWVLFKCGRDNIVNSIQETEVCEYTIKFSTPAAC